MSPAEPIRRRDRRLATWALLPARLATARAAVAAPRVTAAAALLVTAVAAPRVTAAAAPQVTVPVALQETAPAALQVSAAADLRLTAPAALGVERSIDVTVEWAGPPRAALRLLLDGVEVARGPAPRLTAPVALPWPPRRHLLEAQVLDEAGCPRAAAARFLRHPRRAFPVALRVVGQGCDESGPWAWVFAEPPGEPGGGAAEAARVRLLAGRELAGEARGLPARFRLSGRELAAAFLEAEVTSAGSRRATAELVLGVAGPGERIEVARAELRRQLAPRGLLARAPAPAAAVITIDGVPQRLISAEQGEGLPLELGIALDESLSMLPLRAAALELAAESGRRLARAPESRAFLLRFDELTSVSEVPPDGALAADGGPSLGLGATALFDALLEALHELDAGGRRAALVVLTDGCDTASRADADAVIALAAVKGIPVFTLLFDRAPCRFRLTPSKPGDLAPLVDEKGWGQSRHGLERIARASGGRLVRVEGRDDLSAAWRRILDDLDRQTLFVFEPSSPDLDPARAELTFPPSRK